MTDWTKQIPFQVDVAGVIELMGTSLYSRRDTPIRELIQNAHDGIMRRRQSDLSYHGRIDISQDASRGLLRFTDDGIGLTAAEAEEYLGTLGVSLTALIKRGPGANPAGGGADFLIGQFGIGLFSAFMLANRLIVETRRTDAEEGIHWEAGVGTGIELRSHALDSPGTAVTLELKDEFRKLAEETEPLEAAVREYADFLPVPIFINAAKTRTNLINVAWFDPTPDRETVELELESYFDETPLDVIPLCVERPTRILGTLYVTPQRTPGFCADPTVAVTVQRMVISRRIQELLPEWAPFLRGVLELSDCTPTASREDLVRDGHFERVGRTLDNLVFAHFERMAKEDPTRLMATITWHRYMLAGAALTHDRLRSLLRGAYRFSTSSGQLTFEEILLRSEADPLFDTDVDRVIWYNPDRRQEPWISSLFAGCSAPCVHTLMSFEESLLSAMVDDAADAGERIELRVASPSAKGFASGILGVRDIEEASETWQEFLASSGADVFVASFDPSQPVIAFLNERRELMQTMEGLKKEGAIPAGFQRMIDTHFREETPGANEVLLNRNHTLVARALAQPTANPLASVLRLLVIGALNSAGAQVDRSAHRQQQDDLQWIAEALWRDGPKPPLTDSQ